MWIDYVTPGSNEVSSVPVQRMVDIPTSICIPADFPTGNFVFCDGAYDVYDHYDDCDYSTLGDDKDFENVRYEEWEHIVCSVIAPQLAANPDAIVTLEIHGETWCFTTTCRDHHGNAL